MITPEEYTFVRDVTPNEWGPLPHAFKQGETIKRFRGHTYGCDRDDAEAGFSVIACTLDGERFFTVPTEMLRTKEGVEPSPTYLTQKQWREMINTVRGEK